MNSNFYHPSFKPILERIGERGMYSPYAYVQWWPEGEPHGHMVQLGDGQFFNVLSGGGSIEGAAEELSEALMRCDEDRYEGHGKSHSKEDAENAFRGAIVQLMNQDYDRQWIYNKWMQAMHKKWGGHIPALVIQPGHEDSSRWELIIPDEEGNPQIHDVTADLDIPSPEEMDAQKNDYGIGWTAKEKEKDDGGG